MKKLLYIIFILMFSLIFISCNEEPPVIEDVYYNVTFKVDQEETIIKVKENTKVTKPNDPVLRDGRRVLVPDDERARLGARGWHLHGVADRSLLQHGLLVEDCCEQRR